MLNSYTLNRYNSKVYSVYSKLKYNNSSKDIRVIELIKEIFILILKKINL